jgi:hypothetical protein
LEASVEKWLAISSSGSRKSPISTAAEKRGNGVFGGSGGPPLAASEAYH